MIDYSKMYQDVGIQKIPAKSKKIVKPCKRTEIEKHTYAIVKKVDALMFFLKDNNMELDESILVGQDVLAQVSKTVNWWIIDSLKDS